MTKNAHLHVTKDTEVLSEGSVHHSAQSGKGCTLLSPESVRFPTRVLWSFVLDVG